MLMSFSFGGVGEVWQALEFTLKVHGIVDSEWRKPATD